MSESPKNHIPTNHIDIRALAILPAEPSRRQITKALANLPAPLDDLSIYNHPVSGALGHYRDAYAERGSWIWLVIGTLIFFWPGVMLVILALAGTIYGFAQANLLQRMVMLTWVALAVAAWAVHSRRSRRRVATRRTDRFSAKAAPLADFISTVENADVVIRGPGFVWVNSATRDRLVRVSEWLNAWADDAKSTELAVAHASAQRAVDSALERTEQQLETLVNGEDRGAFPIPITGLPQVDAALGTLNQAMQQTAPIWPTPPARVRPLAPVGPRQRRAWASLGKPTVDLNFSQPDIAARRHSDGRVWRDILGAHGVPADLYYEQFPKPLQRLLPFAFVPHVSCFRVGLAGLVLVLVPWLTFVPMLPWRDASRLLPMYYPSALIVLVVMFTVMAVKGRKRANRGLSLTERRLQERSNWSRLTGTSLVLNGEHKRVVADSFGHRLQATSEWARRVEQQHASDAPVAKAARQLHVSIDNLLDAHAQRMQHAINVAPHGGVQVPTDSDQLLALTDDLIPLLTVFQLDTCSPPEWLTE